MKFQLKGFEQSGNFPVDWIVSGGIKLRKGVKKIGKH